MFTPIKDVDREILYRADDRAILETCSVNKTAFEKVCDETFFYNLLMKRYPLALQSFLRKDQNDKTPSNKEMYLTIVYYKDMIRKISKEKYGSEFTFKDGDIMIYYNLILDLLKGKNIYLTAKMGLKDLFYYFLEIPQIKENIDYNVLFNYVVTGNKFTLPEIITIFKGKEIKRGFLDIILQFIASEEPNKEIVEYLLEKGADVNIGLYGATSVGNIPLIQYFIDKGATKISVAAYSAIDITDEDLAIETLKYLENLDDNNQNWSWDDMKIDAASNGALKLLKYTEEHGANDLDEPMFAAMRTRRWNIINYLIERGFDNFEMAYDVATQLNDPELAMFFGNF